MHRLPLSFLVPEIKDDRDMLDFLIRSSVEITEIEGILSNGREFADAV